MIEYSSQWWLLYILTSVWVIPSPIAGQNLIWKMCFCQFSSVLDKHVSVDQGLAVSQNDALFASFFIILRKRAKTWKKWIIGHMLWATAVFIIIFISLCKFALRHKSIDPWGQSYKANFGINYMDSAS